MYPYVIKALTRIHDGVIPQGSYSNDTSFEDWYEQIVYNEDGVEKPSKEAILEEIEKIKEERGEV